MHPHNNFLATHLANALSEGGWRAKARPEQLPPPVDWNGWVVCAGRGFGKTRCGSEWVQECVQTGIATRIGLVGPTAGDVRDVMVEGPAHMAEWRGCNDVQCRRSGSLARTSARSSLGR